MAYSDFTFAGIIGACGLSIVEQDDLFSNVPLVDLPNVLQTILTRHLPLASMLNTEKARSELLIAPMLFELKYLHADRIGVFSGIEF